MNYQEKLRLAKEALASGSYDKETIEHIFPELKESEDERIRKGIVEYLEQSQFGEEHYRIDDDVVRNYIAWLEKQGEQEPINMVEPKFKVGDWVVSPNGVYWHIDAIRDSRYQVSSDSGTCADWPLNTNIYYKFTIRDTKDGDVLYECNEKKPFIFKELKTKHIGDIASYCDIFSGVFNPNEDNWTTLDIVPATKEQRDLLFSKMKEAGYEWDGEKKELSKIEQKKDMAY